ncbi:MAG: tRNA (adenosine(37)-N6)-dimethylallyltransferase MiaA [Candidatus Yanofskybacteria bacterium RIFCSPHIGHO2_01_FULL_43_42]|uniref:tRNA dimethylallyltransferase n=1 Tax=Candidatus Yanofskybacteria bacterium RIFCSPLOWO2_01_FULL_43_22 TaxID=1802695 RepID=A0A1F8GH62_9BACT|nr:MAG: tRNA (adenosine(37)-N6)-dimethylallyltransferase MiaA [Candidatus Yanofskybacteria bacterium RIFCSPHIGHO2_01_FULL_43_42]OGN13344.1 MAG: tRNA (adenosine(37)-N6)-dimethylallyltransferase MiaA [Candidatus Yanofskybacteria bacterium RIFCSPHIGHO2_02_FULL_43_17]OGN24390.1 MAG: tRNA (adenosine(37)-N6)-dimethylallyltransferase MiaA [Candidatus Yanofskybacteria bacterium RIFCSPLOWO2_01_FULL_43_22]
MSKINSTKVIVIVGPTASGKSDLAIKIAKRFGGEIISADSRQVYRGMDIGTGKVARDATFPVPSSKVKSKKLKVLSSKDFYSKGVKHYLIDIASPKKQFTADDFKKLGEKAIKEVLTKNKIPIIVGGTGFYIDVLLERMAVAEVPPNKKLRAQFDKLTVEHLFKMLKKLDPWRAKTIDSKNKRRLIRALEIVISTGKPVTNSKFKILNSKFNILWLGLNPDKEKLTEKIKKRLDTRLKQGMIEEVAQLHKQGISWKRLDDFGLEYRWISRWLRNNPQSVMRNAQFLNSQEFENLLRDIIKYSKRQMTWFKRNPEIYWINPPAGGQKNAEKLLVRFLR